MELIGRAFREFFNVVTSGILLMIALALFFGTMSVPADSPTWKSNGPIGAMVVLLLALFTAFLAYGFKRQVHERRTWVASTILNSLSALAFFGVFVTWVIHHF